MAGSYRNKQVFYRHKKDGDTVWSKEKLLSSGLSYVGSIGMTAEGSKIVIVWQNREGREVYPKASIYFIISKDNGRTWSKYRRVTGIEESSAENPRVSLLRDTIHLFYNQAGTVVYRQCSFPVD
jgi:Neuraminidase (sialidase)